MAYYPALEVKYVKEIYGILKSQDATLSKLEKKVLADALVLIERLEPYEEVLGQIYIRLDFFDRESSNTDNLQLGKEKSSDEIIKGGLNPEVKQLLGELRQDFGSSGMKTAVPGLENVDPFSWDKAINGIQLTPDQTSVLGTTFTFDPTEKFKTMDQSFAKSKEDLINKDAGSMSHSCVFWIVVFIVVLIIIAVLGFLVTCLVNSENTFG